MTEHLSTQLMERYHQNRLDLGEWLALDDHLATCQDCRNKLQRMVPARETLLALQASMHAEPRIEEPGLWKRFLEFSAPAQERTVFRLKPLLAVVAAVVLFVVVALWLRGRINDQALVKTPPSPTASPQPFFNPSPEPPPRILLALNDGGAQVTLDAQGNLTGLESLAPADQRRIKTALTIQKIEAPKMLEELEGASGAAMGGSSNDSFKLISPVGKIVADDRPRFRWQSLDGALSYVVLITDPKANYKEIAVSPALSGVEWRVDSPLARGRVYAWQVTARTNGGEIKAPSRDASEARFAVLEQEKASELARARRDYAGRHLALGLLHAQAGLLDEAEREFQALTAANPESVVVKNLLRDVRAKRRAR